MDCLVLSLTRFHSEEAIMNTEMLLLWSDQLPVSLAVWLVLLVLAMYLGRSQAHLLIMSTSGAVRTLFRLAARSFNLLAMRLNSRNKEIILSHGRDAVEKKIEREFHRVNSLVKKDLSGYPAAQRKINDAIEKIEEDFSSSIEAPPLPPSWVEGVDTIAKTAKAADPTVTLILENINQSLTKAQKEALDEYRRSSQGRHEALKNMLPTWRNVSQQLSEINKNVDGIEGQAKVIDKHMQEYESIRNSEDTAVRKLLSSSVTQLFISGLVLIIAIMGGFINFQLIALPMSEMVGGTSQLGPMKTADVAALVIIMVEIAMGLFLMESLRITHLFPIISSMDDNMRKKMLIITLSILTILAGFEASLAYMRDLLALDREALTQSLAGSEIISAEFRWIPSVGQMVIGFILPFTLAFIAIPLESFIQSFRTVMGTVFCQLLQFIDVAFRMAGNIVQRCGHILIRVYDLMIFIPLEIEKQIVGRKLRIDKININKKTNTDQLPVLTEEKLS